MTERDENLVEARNHALPQRLSFFMDGLVRFLALVRSDPKAADMARRILLEYRAQQAESEIAKPRTSIDPPIQQLAK